MRGLACASQYTVFGNCRRRSRVEQGLSICQILRVLCCGERRQIEPAHDIGPRRPSRWVASALTRVALVLLGMALGLVAAEAGLRVLGLAQPGLYVFDPYTGWALRPNAREWQTKEGRAFVSVNSAGMRDREHPLRKPADTLRIAVLGDSFTEAKQVALEQTFCALLQRDLQACPALKATKIETLNFGCDSYGTAQELMTLRHRAWRFAPDVVVLAICTGNDIRNDSLELEEDKCQPFFNYRDGELVLSGPFEESDWFRMQCRSRFDSQRSALLNFAGQVRSALRARWRGQVIAPHRVTAAAAQVGLDDWIYKPPHTAAQREAWEVAEGEIRMMYHEAAAHGARFLAVTLSNPVQVYPDAAARRAYMQHWELDNLFYPDFRIRALGERTGFDVLNLAPAFQQYADRHHVYLHGFNNTALGTGHWNLQGHRLAADLIAQRLCKLLDQPAPAARPNGAGP